MLVIQFPIEGGAGSEEDLEFRRELEALAAECLQKTNTGTCDGGDIGSGTINVFCTVSDTNATAACKAIVDALDGAGIDGATIAFIDTEDEDAEPNVLWPEGYTGTFSVL